MCKLVLNGGSSLSLSCLVSVCGVCVLGFKSLSLSLEILVLPLFFRAKKRKGKNKTNIKKIKVARVPFTENILWSLFRIS